MPTVPELGCQHFQDTDGEPQIALRTDAPHPEACFLLSATHHTRVVYSCDLASNEKVAIVSFVIVPVFVLLVRF